MAEITHFYDEDNTGGSTTGTNVSTGATPVQIDGSSLSASTKYLVIARGLVGGDNATDKVYVSVRYSSSNDQLDNHGGMGSAFTYEMENTGAANKSWGFVSSFTTASDHDSADNLYVSVYVESGGTAYHDQFSLFVMELDEIGTEGVHYHEDFSPDDSSEYSDSGETVLARILGTTLGTSEEWLILACARTGIGSTGRYHRLTLRTNWFGNNESAVDEQREEGEDTAEFRGSFLVGYHKATVTTYHATLYGEEEAANANATDEGGYIVAIPASYFADLEVEFTAGSLLYNATETTIESLGPYTPTVNGNHLVIGSSGLDISGTKSKSWMEDGTTETRTGDSTPTHDQDWDATKDREKQITFQRISISAQKTYNLKAQGSASGTSASYRWVIVWNLNESGGEPPAEAPRQNLLHVGK